MQNLDNYLTCIRSWLPDLEIHSVSTNLDGLVNDIVFINEEWVFRLPRDASGRDTQVTEGRILDLLRSHVSLPVPEFEACRDEFVRYRKLPGEALSRNAILRQEEPIQKQLAGQLGEFLRQMHCIPAAELRSNTIPLASSKRTREDWLHFYARLEEKLYPLLWAHHKRWVREHFAPVLEGSLDLSYTPALVHGDLGAYHILYDPRDARLNGVIDFGTAGLGDPACDLANLLYYLGESFLSKMSTTYPEIGQAIDRARFWAGTLELQWALNGLQSGDLSWLTNHIGSARDAQPIGSAWR